MSKSTMTIAEFIPYIQDAAAGSGVSVADVLINENVDMAMPLQIHSSGDDEAFKRMLAKTWVTNYKNGTKFTSGAKITPEKVAAPEITPDYKSLTIKAADSASNLRERAAPLLASIMGDFRTATTKENEAVSAAGNAAAEVHMLDAQMAIAQQKQGLATLDRFGINSAGNDAILAENSAKLAATDEAMRRMMPEISAAQSVSPLENVFGWLSGQVKLMELVPKYNAAVAENNQAAGAINTAQKLAAQQKALEPAITQDAILAKAQTAAAMEKARVSIETTKNDKSLLLQEINHIQMLAGFQEKELQASAFMQQLMEQEIERARKAGAEKAEAGLLGRVNTVMKMVGGAEKTVAEFRNMDSKLRDALVTALTEDGKFKSLGDAVALIEQAGSRTSLASDKRAVEVAWLDVASSQALAKHAANLQQQNNNKLSPTELQIASLNKLASEWTEEAKKRSYDSMSSGNPWKPNPKLMASNEKLATNPVAIYVNEQRKNNKDVSLKEVYAYGLGMIRANPKDADAAIRKFHEFLQEGYQFQFSAYGADKYGFSVKNPETGQIELPVSTSLFSRPAANSWAEVSGKDPKVNMLNYSQLRHMMIKDTSNWMTGTRDAVSSAVVNLFGESALAGKNRTDLKNPETDAQKQLRDATDLVQSLPTFKE